jgi:hypothetical protein
MLRDDVAHEAPERVGLHPRIVSILALAAILGGIAYGLRGVYFAAMDAWIAPINLSPDNDAVVQVTIRLNEQLLERAKLRADADRIDADVEGITAALARLEGLRAHGGEALRWTARTTKEQAAALASRHGSLDVERSLLRDMIARESALVDTTQKNVEAGLSPRQDHERELQILAQMRLSIAETERELDAAKRQSAEYRRASEALRAGMPKPGGQGSSGILPELIEREERDARIELEINKLEAERRSLTSQKKVAVESLAKMDEILAQISHRPIYRAVQASTDVAFVPYSQLGGVEAGAEIVTCKWVVFACRTVGRIAEVLPGEVVAQDPWSDVARGQYAILDLTDRDAAKEKVLRARRR